MDGDGLGRGAMILRVVGRGAVFLGWEGLGGAWVFCGIEGAGLVGGWSWGVGLMGSG